jgi:hypothetical protein
MVIGLSVVAPSVFPMIAGSQEALRLAGSGATFPFPLYSTWFKSFSAKQKGVSVDYQGKGSGAGIQDLLNRTVDFAASDAAMTDEDMAKVPGGSGRSGPRRGSGSASTGSGSSPRAPGTSGASSSASCRTSGAPSTARCSR